MSKLTLDDDGHESHDEHMSTTQPGLSSAETALRLGVSQRHVGRMVETGRLVPIRERPRMFSESDVERIREQRLAEIEAERAKLEGSAA